jgi:Mitochondrial K+-H+ exchange-related
MDVFVIPIGADRYELYCEAPVEAPQLEAGASGIIGRLRYRFAVMLHEAEERRRSGKSYPRAVSRLARLQEWIMAWVAERIAEQRLLWNLRRERAVVAVHPRDLTFDQTLTLIHRVLQRDYERHRVWLVVDTLLLVGSIPLTLLPGPNVIGFYFAFRVMGHWLSIRGALQGLRAVTWTGQPCEPLTELREAALLNGAARRQRLREIEQQLRLQHLSTFFERVAVRSA